MQDMNGKSSQELLVHREAWSYWQSKEVWKFREQQICHGFRSMDVQALNSLVPSNITIRPKNKGKVLKSIDMGQKYQLYRMAISIVYRYMRLA
jgi:hypothetical protein